MMPEIKPFKIRDVEINPPLVLSPMAGVTDVSFRRLLKRRGGVGLSVSEFISVEGLTRNNPKSKRQMRFYEDERPFAVQIFGGQPERMCMAAEMAQEVGADILDVNCGCPAPKVVKHGGGSGLLKDHSRLEQILKGIKKTITIPLTVKIRAGFYDHTINAVETAKLAEDCGVEHIALHGRTKEQGYRGLANWDLVKQNESLLRFASALIKFRRTQPTVRREHYLTGKPAFEGDLPDVSWFSALGTAVDWHGDDATLTALLKAVEPEHDPLKQSRDVLILVNASTQPREFILPPVAKGTRWKLLLDTAAAHPYDVYPDLDGPPPPRSRRLTLSYRSMCVFVADNGRK